MPVLPAAVEVATYRIVQEALHNAVRHSRGTRARVEMQLVHGAFEVSVRDNAGVYLRSNKIPPNPRTVSSARERGLHVNAAFGQHVGR